MNKQGTALSLLLVNVMLEILGSAMRLIKGLQKTKEEMKSSLFSQPDYLTKNPRKSKTRLLETYINLDSLWEHDQYTKIAFTHMIKLKLKLER